MPIIPISGSASPRGALVPIGNFVVSNTTTSTVTFASIPQIYQDLRIVISARTNYIGGTDAVGAFFNNGEGGTINSNTYLEGNGASNSSYRDSGLYTFLRGNIACDTWAPSIFSTIITDIFNYRDSNYFKSSMSKISADFNGTGTTQLIASLSRITSPISIITLTRLYGSFFTQGSTFTLYGIRSVNQ
jgi:hypothetical protein